jgi:hypothetical protein
MSTENAKQAADSSRQRFGSAEKPSTLRIAMFRNISAYGAFQYPSGFPVVVYSCLCYYVSCILLSLLAFLVF